MSLDLQPPTEATLGSPPSTATLQLTSTNPATLPQPPSDSGLPQPLGPPQPSALPSAPPTVSATGVDQSPGQEAQQIVSELEANAKTATPEQLEAKRRQLLTLYASIEASGNRELLISVRAQISQLLTPPDRNDPLFQVWLRASPLSGETNVETTGPRSARVGNAGNVYQRSMRNTARSLDQHDASVNAAVIQKMRGANLFDAEMTAGKVLALLDDPTRFAGTRWADLVAKLRSDRGLRQLLETNQNKTIEELLSAPEVTGNVALQSTLLQASLAFRSRVASRANRELRAEITTNVNKFNLTGDRSFLDKAINATPANYSTAAYRNVSVSSSLPGANSLSQLSPLPNNYYPPPPLFGPNNPWQNGYYGDPSKLSAIAATGAANDLFTAINNAVRARKAEQERDEANPGGSGFYPFSLREGPPIPLSAGPNVRAALIATGLIRPGLAPTSPFAIGGPNPENPISQLEAQAAISRAIEDDKGKPNGMFPPTARVRKPLGA